MLHFRRTETADAITRPPAQTSHPTEQRAEAPPSPEDYGGLHKR